MEAKAEARWKAIAIATELENQKVQEAAAAEAAMEKRRNRGSSSSASEPRSKHVPNDSFEADLGKVTVHYNVSKTS